MNDFVHKVLDSTVGNLFGKDVTCREPVDRCDDYQPGTLTEFGRTGIKLFKKFLMPCGLCAAVPAVKVAPPPPDCPVPCNHTLEDKTKLIRPSELPIYAIENASCSRQIPCPDDNCAPSSLEQGFGVIRKTVKDFYNEYRVITDTVHSKIETGIEHSQFLLDYLKEESNVLPRLGAIGIGGLTGLVLGLRGGKFKRLVYSSTGALTVAAICYPRQAQESFNVVKHYTNIGYNFIYGVKPGEDNRLEIAWPTLPTMKLPSSFSEFVDLTVETGASVGEMIGSLTDKASEALNQKKEVQPSAEASTPKQN